MPKTVLIDEVHVHIHVSHRASDREVQRIRRTLKHPRFLIGLRRTMRQFLARFPSLSSACFTVSR